jgi:predicted ArsR family transcriptional regulator
VVQDAGGALDIVGALPDAARRVFRALAQAGTAAPEDVARRLDLSPDAAREALEDLLERGLVIAHAGTYGPPTT